MNKRFFCVFLVFLIALFSFAACEKRSRYGVIMVDKQGMEHVIATDANGVTLQDKFGNLVEVMTDSKSKKPMPAPTQTVTDESGEVVSVIEAKDEYATNSITFPALIEDDQRVENKFYYVTIPEGWTNEGSTRVQLRHTETGAVVSFYDDMDKSFEEILEDMENQRAKLGGEFVYNETEEKIGEFDAVCMRYEIGKIIRETYLYSAYGKVFQITCTVDADKEQLVGFDSILNSIVFK